MLNISNMKNTGNSLLLFIASILALRSSANILLVTGPIKLNVVQDFNIVQKKVQNILKTRYHAY